MATTKMRGTCQICERDVAYTASAGQSSLSGQTSHHGYSRPGHGWLVGGCPGSKRLPYELSCKALDAYREQVATWKAERETYLARLQAGEVETIRIQMSARALTPEERAERRLRPFDKVWIDMTAENAPRYLHGSYRGWTWEGTIVAGKIRETDRDIRHATAEVARIDERIAAWTFNPAGIKILDA